MLDQKLRLPVRLNLPLGDSNLTFANQLNITNSHFYNANSTFLSANESLKMDDANYNRIKDSLSNKFDDRTAPKAVPYIKTNK
jgi:hypothetical protein